MSTTVQEHNSATCAWGEIGTVGVIGAKFVPVPALVYMYTHTTDGLIDYEEFKMLNARYPIVLFPAFRLQDAIQVHTLGTHPHTHTLQSAISPSAGKLTT